MMSWIHILAAFTPEALLLEAGGIFLLLCAYAAFWILRKRRYGAIETDLPSGPVKAYLNELIFNAEQLRAQLFGITASKDVRAFSPQTKGLVGAAQAPSPASTGASLGIDAQNQLDLLQLKINEQANQIDTLTQEKAEAVQQAAAAASNGAAAGGRNTDSGNDEAMRELKAKAADLENKLLEYSVIEDDLANLSKLMKENIELKAKLAGQPAPQNASAGAAPNVDEVIHALSAQEEPTQPSAPAAATATTAPAPVPAPVPAPATTAAQTTPNSSPALDATHSDLPPEGDLVEEFEKMLNG